MSQPGLSKASGIAQTSVSLLLNPQNRAPGKEGRIGSPTLAQVETVADALGVEAWELICPMSGEQWIVYQAAQQMHQAILGQKTAPAPTEKQAPARKLA